MEKFSERTSTILPLPSSPHCAPTMTAVLPFFKFNSVEVSCTAALAALQGRTHFFHPRRCAIAEILGIYAEQVCTSYDTFPSSVRASGGLNWISKAEGDRLLLLCW